MQAIPNKAKCQHPEGVEVKINGVPVDPCEYEVAEIYENVTVEILRCRRCGNIQIEWRYNDEEQS